MDRHLCGQTFGRWHVIGYAGKNNGYKVWMCKCDCGTMREVRESHLLDGRSKSCGCLIHDKPSWNYKGTPDIVRCKDCKNWIAGYITDKDEFIPPKCGKYQQMVGHSNDDFCSLAERQ